MNQLLWNIFLFAGLLCMPREVCAQKSIRSYVQENQAAVRCIDPDSVNYDDLGALGSAIGESRVVMLGEQEHGDATTFLAKARIVKYLHEKKGFNVLVFEGDFFALNRGWDSLQKEKKTIDSFLFYNVPYVWAQCQTCRSLLYDYIPGTYKTSAPLVVSGMDPQFLGYYSLTSRVADQLDSMVSVAKLSIGRDPAYKKKRLPRPSGTGIMY